MKALLLALSLVSGGCLGCAPRKTITIAAERIDTLSFTNEAMSEVVKNAKDHALLCLHGTAIPSIPQIKVEQVSLTDDVRTCNGIGLLTFGSRNEWMANQANMSEWLTKAGWKIIICVHSLRVEKGVIIYEYSTLIKVPVPSSEKRV